MIASRDIAKDEEVTYDYSTSESEEKWTMECKCGAHCCRKIVTGRDWKRVEIIKKYNNHFLGYLQKIVNEIVEKQKIKL